jgi:hypothetical protein
VEGRADQGVVLMYVNTMICNCTKDTNEAEHRFRSLFFQDQYSKTFIMCFTTVDILHLFSDRDVSASPEVDNKYRETATECSKCIPLTSRT